MRIGVLGSGTVGTTLAGGFLAHGHDVMIGSARMVNPVYEQGRPSMFICGNDQTAKLHVSRLLDQVAERD